MKISRQNRLMSLMVTISILVIGCNNTEEINHNNNFRQQMVKALRLKYINMDTCYHGSLTRIFNDTIVGFYTSSLRESYNDDSGSYFFVQSLHNLKNKITFNPDISTPIFIDELKNGGLYFGGFGQSYMVRVDTVGRVQEYFKNYQDTMFYAKKVMLYKNRTAILSMNGLFVFDTDEQRLLWKHKFSKVVEISDASVINGKLIFHECKEDTIKKKQLGLVHCFDLDELLVAWTDSVENDCFLGESGQYQESNHLANRRDELILRSNKVVRILDIATGSVKHQSSKLRSAHFDERGNGYYGDTDSGAIYLDSNFHVRWQLNGIRSHSVYKENFIGTTLDRRYYVIVDKLSGKVRHRIANNYLGDNSLAVIDGYFIIDRFYLYR